MFEQKLRVWWVPQIPMEPFITPVSSIEEGVKIMEVLAQYDLFQYYKNVKPNYCNTGGLQFFDPTDDVDSPEGSWVDWFIETEDDWFEDPEDYLEYLANKNASTEE